MTAPAPPKGSWTPVFLLFLSFLGFLGIAFLLYSIKFDGVTAHWHGFPTRLAYILLLALVAAPFALTIFRRVPVVFLALPVLLIFFIYPIFSPSGLPYSRDTIFNFQFAQAIQSAGTWQPLNGVIGQAGVYSYFPGGAVFNVEASSMTSLPLLQTFPWAYELFRLLIIPLAIYALASRLFGPRSAPLAVLFYISVPSIELNIPTQQDFAVTFFVLAFAALAFLATENSLNSNLTILRVTVVVAAAMIIISHHVSTYILIGFLAGLAVLPWILRRKDPYPAMRSFAVLFGAISLALVWVAAISLPVLEAQRGILGSNLSALIHPTTTASQSIIPGGSFPLYLIAWIAAAAAVEGLLAIVVLAESYRRKDRAFVTFSILTAILVAVLSVPFFSTGFNFLVLRQFEYTGVIFAPAAAWWIAAHFGGGEEGLSPRPAPTGSPAPPPVRRKGWSSRPPSPLGRIGYPLLAVGIIVLIFAGGSLVPLSTRDQFAPPSEVLIDSPVHINQTVYAAAIWAEGHLNSNHSMWGDYLAYTVFGGFAGFRLRYDSYALYQGTGFSPTAISRLHSNDYIVVDTYMTKPVLQPEFYGPLSDQPTGPLNTTELAKFNQPLYFSVLYQDMTFTIYEYTGPPLTAS
ncbi:MAG: hypothetical protein L3K02_04230 [Thermoplasmata archaeon]|nr:hypothetical protein [Thermoplasmata archaeon]